MVRIQFHDLRIGTVSGSSGIFQGRNLQWKTKHAAKQNLAFGTVNGRQCVISDVRASLDDGDRFDAQSIIKTRQT